MKLFNNIYVAISTLILSVIILSISVFNFKLSEVSNDDTLKEIVIDSKSNLFLFFIACCNPVN